MNIEQATRMVHLLEAKRDATYKAIDSLTALSRKFEATPSDGARTLAEAWLTECRHLTMQIGECELVIQTTTTAKKERHLTVVN